MALLGEVGHAGTTVEAIAERSGVAKTTIYRHWPTRAQPCWSTRSTAASTTSTWRPTGDLRADLVRTAGGLAAKLRDPRWSRIMATLIDAAESDPELAELSAAFTAQRREGARRILERGVADGELRPGHRPRPRHPAGRRRALLPALHAAATRPTDAQLGASSTSPWTGFRRR